MRVGCGGCLVGLALAGLVAVGLGAGIRSTGLALAPPMLPERSATQADGRRAQQKLYDLLAHGRARRQESVVLTEREVNGLISRHLAYGFPLRDPFVRLLGDDRVDLYGRTLLRDLLDGTPAWSVAGYLPGRWLDRQLWGRVQLRVVTTTVGGRRSLRLDVEQLWLGRQRLPAILLRLVLDPATLGWLHLRLPDAVDRVGVEPGRVVIRASS